MVHTQSHIRIARTVPRFYNTFVVSTAIREAVTPIFANITKRKITSGRERKKKIEP